MSEANAGRCECCDQDVEERCWDGYCRECHVSLTFEECVSGEWVVTRYRRRSSMSSVQRNRAELMLFAVRQ